jgi:hypothetical protein
MVIIYIQSSMNGFFVCKVWSQPRQSKSPVEQYETASYVKFGHTKESSKVLCTLVRNAKQLKFKGRFVFHFTIHRVTLMIDQRLTLPNERAYQNTCIFLRDANDVQQLTSKF